MLAGKTEEAMNMNQWDVVNLAFALCVHGVMAALGWFVFSRDTADAALTISFQGFGIVVGFWVGVFVSPISTRERADLTTAGKVISAFTGGYLLSKLDPVVTSWLKEPHDVDSVAMFRFLSFGSSLLAQALVVSSSNWYGVRPVKEDKVLPS
jgi:hypothetical protein